MNKKEILAHVDHTLLAPDATWSRIRGLCEEGIRYGCASVCIPPVFVKKAAAFVGDQIPVCTVIGFPNGTSTCASKCFEAQDAVANGASEIDMVIHVGALREGNDLLLLDEISAVREACCGRLLKVIVEACLLTTEEKRRICSIVSESGADFIKTSTGFSTGGATFEDVALFRETVSPRVKIKAAGGISSFEDAEKFLQLGASRLGTSRLVRLMREEEKL